MYEQISAQPSKMSPYHFKKFLSMVFYMVLPFSGKISH